MMFYKYRHFYFQESSEQSLDRLFKADFCFIGPAPRGWYNKFGIRLRKRDPYKIRPKMFDK